MTLPEESNKHEIVVSKTTSDLATFSANALTKRGFDVADLAIKSSHLLRAKQVLLSIINNNNLKHQPHQIQEAIKYSAQLLLRINANKEILYRLTEISKDTDWHDYTRLDMLEILAKQEKNEFTVQEILEIFDKPNAISRRDIHNIRNMAIYKLKNIGVKDDVQHKILEFTLSHDNFLLFETLQLLERSGKISRKIYSTLRGILVSDFPAAKKLDICQTLIELGYAQEIRGYLPAFQDYKGKDSSEIIYRSQKLLHHIKVLGNETKFFLENINNQTYPISWRIDLLSAAFHRQTLEDVPLYSIKIVDIEKWFQYLKDKGDFFSLLELSQLLVDMNIETEHVAYQLLTLIDAEFSQVGATQSKIRGYAFDILRNIEIPLKTIQEKIVPYMESEEEELETRISAASILCKHLSTRHKGVNFILSQTDHSMNFGFDDQKFETISLLGYDSFIVNKLFNYINTPNLPTVNRALACMCVVEMTRK